MPHKLIPWGLRDSLASEGLALGPKEVGVVTLAGAESGGQQLLWLVEQENHFVCEGEEGSGV